MNKKQDFDSSGEMNKESKNQNEKLDSAAPRREES